MEISIHNYVRGKPDQVIDEDSGKPFLSVNGCRINLGWDWTNIEASWEDIFDLITIDGIATSAALLDNHRHNGSFKSRQLVLVDVDEGMRIEELLEDEFYNTYGAGFYTTPSHTQENHRFRIMFRLEEPITNSDDMKAIFIALMKVFTKGDASCKDATRIFFGTINCEIKERRDNMLSVEDTELLIKLGTPEPRQPSQPVNPAYDDNDTEIAEVLDELKKHYGTLEYNRRRDVTWAVLSKVKVNLAIPLLRSRWPDAESTGKYEKFAQTFSPGKIGFGTIIHMIRTRDSSYRRFTPKEKRAPIRETKFGTTIDKSILL